ncbi:unannotated protein [freshwater metagenome]|uniref:Unannotated protein n=1 Tax=freshwater metagenome TaxID=449393 RepID=A0A6J7E6X2_9ZZZZ
MRVDAQARSRQFEHLALREHLLSGSSRREVAALVPSVIASTDLNILASQSNRGQCRALLVDDVGIRLDFARHHHLAESEGCLDDEP